MKKNNPKPGMSTLLNHAAEGEDPIGAHVMPIYQTSTFRFPDAASGAERFKGNDPGYIYTRLANPNSDQLAQKLAALEGLDLTDPVAGMVFSSGMAAITSAIMARVHSGQKIVAHKSLYGATYNFLQDLAPQYGIEVIWTRSVDLADWEAAFEAAGDAVLAVVETPTNPTMSLVDIAGVAKIAQRHSAWVLADNTFATPYCQRPLTLGADIVVHSTTKYLSGHGLVIGGAVVSRHVEYVKTDLIRMLKLLGGSPSPFDAWLTAVGLRTFELRMQAHCRNAMIVAKFLEAHPKVEKVHYPGLESHPDHQLAKRQMSDFGGMVSFELKGGLAAGEAMMNRVKVVTLAVSLGNVDSLIMHPASMSHAGVPPEVRRATGLSDGLVRLSVGIENVEDIIADLDQSVA